MHSAPWHQVSNVAEVASPALLIHPERIEENIRRMLRIVGPDRLRPHIKTHKMAELVRMQMALGIDKFKCATIAEAEMAGACGARDVLLAYQPVGPNIRRLIQLGKTFPQTKFSCLSDDAEALRALSHATAQAGERLDVFLDINCGMNRSGVSLGQEAIALYRLISTLPGLNPAGLHAYDGHIHDRDYALRVKACESAFALVDSLREQLARAGLPVPAVVAGGTPTFPILAERKDVQCSPGTCVLWDFGYTTKLPDMDFLPAAVLLTRVVSKPSANRLCLDLGHKAVASENPHPRVQLLEVPEAAFVGHSEEHLVIETIEAARFPVGTALYGIPWHICPTVALHEEAVVVRNGTAQERWKISARARRLTI